MNLYFRLKDLYDVAVKGDKTAFVKLNSLYEAQMPRDRSQTWILNYDNARQSCYLALSFPNMREKCLADAKERLEDILKYPIVGNAKK